MKVWVSDMKGSVNPIGSNLGVSGMTPVLRADGITQPINQICRDAFVDGIVEEDSGDEILVRLNNPIGVYSYDGHSFISSTASRIYQGISSRMIEIITRTNRKIEVTPFHRLPTFNGETIEERKAQFLQPGDYLIAPRWVGKITAVTALFSLYDFDLGLRAVEQGVLDTVTQLMYKVMNQKNMDLTTLGKKCGVSYFVAYGFYKQKNKPTLQFIKRLATLAGISPPPVVFAKAERQSNPFRIPSRMNDEFAEWLGLFIADGHIKGNKGVYLYNTSSEILNRWNDLTESIFELKTVFGQDDDDRTPYQRTNSVNLLRFLYHIGIPKNDKTSTVRVPYCILLGNTELLTHFLTGYFAGDGHFSRYTIEFGSTSRNLIYDMSYILARLGVLFSFRSKKTDGKDHHRVTIDGEQATILAEMFREFDCYHYEKLKPLFAYASSDTKHFRGLDIVPVSPVLLSDVSQEAKNSRGHSIFKKNGVNMYNFTTLGEIPSVKTVQKMVSIIDSVKNGMSAETRNRLHRILCYTENLFFDRIKEINIIEEETKVYKLVLKDQQNYIGGYLPILLM
ncbi:MAG: LAGLIDADG family homing endonuclease [Candidatus Odinarchaeota archaeon]